MTSRREPGPSPDWLVARPIAHRGLHDMAAGIVENSLSAARAAVAAGFAIECDVQRSRDGEAVVFHDATLARLTDREGAVADRTAAELGELRLGNSMDRILTLPAMLDAIDGRVALVCEIKSAFDGDVRLVDRVAQIASTYDGPLALKSFDPAVLTAVRGRMDLLSRGIPLGLVAEADYMHPEWAALPRETRRRLAAMAHFPETRPDFLSYAVDDLPHAAAVLFRAALGRPVMSWTVRTPEQTARAGQWADQMVFEGFRP